MDELRNKKINSTKLDINIHAIRKDYFDIRTKNIQTNVKQMLT